MKLSFPGLLSIWVLGLLMASIASPVRADSLTLRLLDTAGKPLVGAVVALEQAGLPRRARTGSEAAMAQRERQFQPRLLVVQTGTLVRFPNEDVVRHHVYSYSPAKTFELKLYLGEAAAPVLFDKPGVVVLGCNIHDQMSAQIVVVDTPVHGVTNASGDVRLERRPGPGQLRAWHPSLPRPELQSLALPAASGESTVTWTLR